MLFNIVKRDKMGTFRKTDIMKEFPLQYVWAEVSQQYIYNTGLAKDPNTIYAGLFLPCRYLPLTQI